MNHRVEIFLNRMPFAKPMTEIINGEREDGIFIPIKYNSIIQLGKYFILKFTAAELKRKKAKKKYDCSHVLLPVSSKTQRFYLEKLGINIPICGYLKETWAEKMAREEAEGIIHDDDWKEENKSISTDKVKVLNILDDEEDYSINYPYEFKILERVIERYPYDDDDTIPDGEEENTKEFLKTFLYKIKKGEL